MDRSSTILDNPAASGAGEHLSIHSKTCFKMAFWPIGMCYPAAINPFRRKLVKVGMQLGMRTLVLASGRGQSLLEIV